MKSSVVALAVAVPCGPLLKQLEERLVAEPLPQLVQQRRRRPRRHLGKEPIRTRVADEHALAVRGAADRRE